MSNLDSNSYSIDQMLRYAFEYEVLNRLKLPDIEIPEDVKQAVTEYFECRISEIKNKSTQNRT